MKSKWTVYGELGCQLKYKHTMITCLRHSVKNNKVMRRICWRLHLPVLIATLLCMISVVQRTQLIHQIMKATQLVKFWICTFLCQIFLPCFLQRLKSKRSCKLQETRHRLLKWTSLFVFTMMQGTCQLAHYTFTKSIKLCTIWITRTNVWHTKVIIFLVCA